MFFLFNTANSEVIGFYNQRDYVNALRRNSDLAQLSSIRAAEIMREQIWEIDPNYSVDLWGNAEDVYAQYIRRSNLYNN